MTPERGYRSWAEMKAEGIEIETMQEYVDEVRGLHDYEPDPPDAYDDFLDGLDRDEPDDDEDDEPYTDLRERWGNE